MGGGGQVDTVYKIGLHVCTALQVCNAHLLKLMPVDFIL